MKIKTFLDFTKLKEGQWLSTPDGLYEVVNTIQSNSCISLAEIIFTDDTTDDFKLGAVNPNVTFADIKNAELV